MSHILAGLPVQTLDMRRIGLVLCFAFVSIIWPRPTFADLSYEVVPDDLLAAGFSLRAEMIEHISKPDTMVLIDYRQPSSARRLYVVDLQSERVRTELVAHGKGSDPDHDSLADTFSNTHGSKMTSLGAFVTGKTYYGKHGLSLRLHGLEPINDEAMARAIVIHGADYVTPDRNILGRSWGCPALEQSVALELIPDLADGVFIYAIGP